MDVAYLALAGLFWALVLGLAAGCERLQPRGGRP